ncbi:MAG: glycosyltransferase family 4 protein [Akkermansiaceae bacterium]|nr:glycosyltransferase family 4 protein [Akkermansiaceae bacterium]
MNFICSSPDLNLSGANQLLASLLQGFIEHGHSAEWVITSHEGNGDSGWLNASGLKLINLPRTPLNAVRDRQQHLIDRLNQASPCLYFPNFDFDMMWAIPAFPVNCRSVFIFHSDDPVYYQAVKDHGKNLDAIVCVSAYLASKLQRLWPQWKDRIHHIPFGVTIPLAEIEPARSTSADGLLEVVYCGRLAHEQKLIGDLADIILKCHERNLPIQFHIAGTGPDETEFFQKIAAPLSTGSAIRHGLVSNENVQILLRRSHIFILTSAYEGLPVSLLEAMAAGCVPVVTRVASGIPEVITHGTNGFIFPIHDTAAMVEQLAMLAENREEVVATAHAAKKRIAEGNYTRTASVSDYLVLCETLTHQKNTPRKYNRAVLPPNYRLTNRLKSLFNRLS